MAAAPDELAREIRRQAETMGASHFGVADVTRAYEARPESFEECGKLLTGIAVAVPEDDRLLDGLPQTDSAYRTSHYARKIALALRIADGIAKTLTDGGYKAHRLSHPPTLKPTGLYKLVARFAGLGWIGRNHLLITPDEGPRVALAAVLTDAPLPATAARPMEDRCGDCTLCIAVCPVLAFKNAPLNEAKPLESFETGKCATLRGVINPSGWGGCGLCMQVCPYGQTHRKRME
jgi:epoxyqueuosine reductase QueG